MLEIYQRLERDERVQIVRPDYKLLLTHDERSRARLKAQTVTGEEIGIFLEHGQPLMLGDILVTSCSKTVRVDGAAEPVLSATCDDWRLFARACYHLGNRHVKIQIAERTLRITPDHVLQSMLESLGLSVRQELAVFVPENGAYHGHGHEHSHNDTDELQSDKKQPAHRFVRLHS